MVSQKETILISLKSSVNKLLGAFQLVIINININLNKLINMLINQRMFFA